VTESVSRSSIGSAQILREGMAIIISLMVLVLTAYTLYGTFQAASTIVPLTKPADPSALGASSDANYERLVKSHGDAYARQKDIMLYALALFGTVMGYYLGRVPAEANANRAERTAEAAQEQLSKSQDRLVETSATASAAGAEVGRVKEEKASLDAKLHTATKTLRDTSATISATRKARSEGAKGRATAGGSGASVSPVEVEQDEALRRAQEEIDLALARIEESSR
jgi:hypothetical protein